ncbi:MAG: alpha/beta fold hydrolase [Gammaproteobacteria bacterium]
MRKIFAGVVIAIFLAIAFLLAAAWAPDRPVDDLKARWATPPSAFLELRGMSVHLRDEGFADDKPPILLLHGTSASLHTWDGWVEALAPSHRVIRVDLPGFGLTGPFPHDDYHVTAYVDFVIALLDSLAVPEAILAGNSLGGQIAWEVAVTAPERVVALVLVNAAGYALEPESIPIAFRIARTPALQPLMTRLLPRRMIEASVRNVYGDPELVSDELVDRYYELALREGNRRALGLRLDEAVYREVRADRIAMITQPTLILWGGQDQLIPPKTAEQFAHDIADSRLIIFDSLGHVPHEEDPQSTSSAVRAFLDSVPASDRQPQPRR